MKIGIDATALYGRFGGVELALWNLLTALRDAPNSYQWMVYLPLDNRKADWENFPLNWRFGRLPFRGADKARRIAWQQTQFSTQARRDGCDILHCPTYVCPLLSPLPVVLTIYDFIALTHPHFATPLNRAHYHWMLPRSARRADRILVPSEAVRRELLRRVPDAQSKTQVVPLGVERAFSTEFSPEILNAAREKWHLPSRFLLFVGNPEPKKNVAAILAAMQLLPAHLREIPLVVTGGARAWGEHKIETTYQSAANPNILALVSPDAPSVLNIGWVPRAELPLLYALCEVFVFPSIVEGFGLPVLEALACGAPVVCSNRVPIENLESVALQCEPHDFRALAQHIAQVLASPNLRAELQVRGREFARAFSWQRSAQMTLEIYASLGK